MSGCGMGVVVVLLVLVIIGLLVYFFFLRDTGTEAGFLLPVLLLLPRGLPAAARSSDRGPFRR